MRNRIIKTAAALPGLKVADPEFNGKEIIRIMKENKDCGLIVFPELCITGYTCADLFGHAALLDAAEAALCEIRDASKKLPGLTAVVGLPVRYKNKLYSAAAFICEGRIAGVVPKINIANYSEFYEVRWFASGRGIRSAELKLCGETVPFGSNIIFSDERSGASVGTDICEDLWVPDKPSTHACLAGANIIVNLSASDETIGKQEYRAEMVRQQSGSCYCAYIYSSSGTNESSTDLVFSGHSMIADSGMLLKDEIFREAPYVNTALIDLEKTEYNRRHQNTFASGKESGFILADVSIQPAGGYEISADGLLDVFRSEGYSVEPNPFVPANGAERGRRCRRILQIQANGLASRVRSTGIKTLVIGISGGLDSTLALLVCVEARKIVSDIRIIAITMPNKGNTSSLTYNNALSLMRAADVEIREIPIGQTVQMHLKDIGHAGEYQGEDDKTYENAQARMRTYILMDTANMEGGIVVGTGDLSELALGWCTYNGDHMSMYGVNASVPKTLVRFICETYADECDNDLLKETLLSVAATPITPELTPSRNGEIAQKTEEKIGSYDLNDFFLFYCLRYGFAPDKIYALARTAYPALSKEEAKAALTRFFKRFFAQQFKRSCLPDGPKVGSVTLSPRGDWRMPSDATAAAWLKRIEDI